MKTQSGYIFRKTDKQGRRYGPWFLRYYDTVLHEGKSVRVQLCKKLAPFNDEFRSEKSVRPLAAEILQPINAGTLDVRSTMPVSAFIEAVCLPEAKEKLRASTYKNYRDIFRVHVQPRLGEITLRHFRCCDGIKCRKSKSEHRTDGHMFELDRTLCWHGWHAFRRGLATTLHQLGVPDKEILGILRHSNVTITQASYNKCVAESQVDALDLVAAEMRNDEPCNDHTTEAKRPVN